MPGRTQPEAMSAEREMLVRFCARYTGDADAAEDLAQQALLAAWRHERQLRDPRARRGWLFSIARNACLMWARGRSHERARLVELGRADGRETDDQLADDFDLEQEIERDDLARLLDRALARLPPDTREVLVRRYVEEAPQAEVAARLGLTEGAVEARLHRGKRALKRVLATDLGDEAVAFGLLPPDQVGWQETRIWCPGCGKRRLDGQFLPDQGKLYLRCPACSRPGEHYIHAHMGDGLKDVRSYRPALSRVLCSIHHLFRTCPVDGVVPCWRCGMLLPIERGVPPWARGAERRDCTYLRCPICGWDDRETWHSLTWSLPEARRFWQEHPRMRFLPEREVEADGSPAVVTGFESLTGGARLEVVTLRDSLRVVRVHVSPSPMPRPTRERAG